MQITIDNCVEVEQIAKDLLLEDLLQNIGDCYKTYKTVLDIVAIVTATHGNDNHPTVDSR